MWILEGAGIVWEGESFEVGAELFSPGEAAIPTLTVG